MQTIPSAATTIVGVIAHAVLSPVLVFLLIGSAYAFSRTAGAQIGSYDELNRLGPSPRIAVIALVLIWLVTAVVSAILLVVPATRSRAWVAPLVGAGCSCVTVILAVVTLQPAVPYVGG